MPMKQLFYGAVQAVQQLVQAHGIDLQMETQFTECRSVFLRRGSLGTGADADTS